MVSTTETKLRSKTKASFGLKINFDKEHGDPSRVFITMSELIRAYQDIDRKLVSSIPIEIEPILLLEDIQQGSLITWLGRTFNLSGENPNLGFSSDRLDKYLDKSNSAIVAFTKDKTAITPSGLEEIQMKIYDVLSEVEPTPNLPIYTPVPKKELLLGMQKVQSAVSHLTEAGDSAAYINRNNTEIPFNLTLNITPDSIEDILTKETLKNESKMLLKVKKPDYLGASQWEFREGKKTLNIRISDFEWLKRFRNRDFVLAPGDSLLAIVEIIQKYDIDNNLISERYTLLEVIELRPANTYNAPKQMKLGSFEDV